MLCQPSSRRPSSHRLRACRRAGSRNLARRVDRRSYASSCVSSQRVCNESRPQTQAAVTKVATGFHRGQQYSVTALTNGGGTVTERYAYDAYGTPTILDASGTSLTTSAENNRYTYTGREYDEDLGLYHYRARMYDSVAGRFCSRDPIGFEGSPWLLYEYASGKVLIATDSGGLSTIVLGGTAGGAAAAAGGGIGGVLGAVGTAIGGVVTTVSGVVVVAAAGGGFYILGQNYVYPTLADLINSNRDGIDTPYNEPMWPPDLVDSPPGSCPADTDGGLGNVNSNALPGPLGAEEWGRLNGVNPSEARHRFHNIKQRDGMSGATDDYTTDPISGDVFDPEGEYVGNVGDDYQG